MLQLHRPLIFFDLETTGVRVETDRIVQIAAIKLHPSGHQEELNKLVNPTVPIPAEATAIHGISDEHVADQPTFSDHAEDYAKFFWNSDLAGFNSNRFDIPLLANELVRAGFYLDLNCHCIDVCSIFHAMEPRNLAAAYRLYCGAELEDAHDALADVRATIAVLRGQLEYYADRPHPPDQPELQLVPDLASLSKFSPKPSPDPSRKLVLNNEEELVFSFGKYKDVRLSEVARTDPGYLEWVLNKDFSETTKILVRLARDAARL